MNPNDYIDIDHVCPVCKRDEALHPSYSEIPGNATIECECDWSGTKGELTKRITYYKHPPVDRVVYMENGNGHV